MILTGLLNCWVFETLQNVMNVKFMQHQFMELPWWLKQMLTGGKVTRLGADQHEL